MNKKDTWLFGISILLATYLNAQQNNSGFQFNGNISLYGDFYHMESDTLNAVAPRRPNTVTRLVANANFTIQKISIPFSIIIPFQQHRSIILEKPAIPNTPLWLYIRNPQNRIGISPTYKWCKVFLGSHILQYSELSIGDYPVFGFGTALTPGRFRFSGFSGTTQLAIEADTLKKITGTYSRHLTALKIGYGKEGESHVYLIGCMIKDDTNSIHFKPENLVPEESMLVSIEYRLNLGKHGYIKGEVAGSAFTRDSRSDEVNNPDELLPGAPFVVRESTRLDGATWIKSGADWKQFGITITGRYYGDGFVSLGYPFLQTDKLEVTVDPKFTLLKNKMQFICSIGQRVNNLSGIRATTTTQTIGSGNLNIQFTEQLSISASYSNFGFRNSLQDDTFRVQLVTQAWSLSPSYTLITDRGTHAWMGQYSKNSFKDFNIISGELNDNNSNSIVLTYLYSLIQKPLSAGVTLSYITNKTALTDITTSALNVNIGYKFFDKKLTTNGGLTLCDNTIDQQDAGFQIMAIGGVKYILHKKLTLSITGSVNLYEFGSTRPGISYRENLARTSLVYKL